MQEKEADLVHNKAMYESQVISNVFFGNYCLRFLSKNLLHKHVDYFVLHSQNRLSWRLVILGLVVEIVMIFHANYKKVP